MLGKKLAQALDTAAAKAYETGTKLAGETGGKAADALMNVTVGSIRDRLGHECTRPDCDHA